VLGAPGHVNRYLRYTYTNSVSNPFVYHTYANARDRFRFFTAGQKLAAGAFRSLIGVHSVITLCAET
jgi:hypothetical protein